MKWEFMDHVLNRMQFGIKWKSWIRCCLTIAEMSIIINGSPTKSFRMERGLRQGDLFSPFLFVLITKVLNLLISKVEKRRLIKDLKVGWERVRLSHLQFADDTILFCPARYETVVNYRRILNYFGEMSGLRISYDKSALVPIHCDEE